MVELYYGIALPEDSEYDRDKVELKKSYRDLSEVMKVMKDIKGTRFKTFKTQEEAEEYSTNCVPAVIQTSSDPTLLSSPKPSEKSEFKSLKPQEEVKFRKAIERSPSDLEFLRSCIESNARYLVTPSDTPTILHQGPRHNALHVAARHGKLEAAQVVLDQVTGGLMARMYPAECSVQNQRRREYLVDMYLNMPDKGGGDTPLHLAAKFGQLELVRLISSFHQTRLEQLNRNGETAVSVICSRAGDEQRKREITALLAVPQVVIPVYREQGETGQLGRPISLKAAADLLETQSCSSEQSFSSQSSLAASSPLVQSSRARVTPDTSLGRSPRSPLVSSSSPISALLGPLPVSRAEKLWRVWKGGERGEGGGVSPARERLEDPSLGLERQGRQLAGREGTGWLEFWPWLGEYADLTTEQGLVLLDSYLEEKIREARETQDRDNQEDLEDELEASLLITGGRGREGVECQEGGELEFVSKMSSSTPAKVESWRSYRSGDGDDTDNNANTSLQPLSPVSSLMNEFGSLNLDNQHSQRPTQEVNNLNISQSLANLTSPPTRLQSSVSEDVTRTLEQFVVQVVGRLAESLPSLEVEEVTAWVSPVLNHWAQLRRQVNNWRSDPLARWAGLDWDQLAVSLVDPSSLPVGISFKLTKLPLVSIWRTK